MNCVCVYQHEELRDRHEERIGTFNLRKEFLFIEEGSNCPCVFKEYTGGSEIHKCFESEKIIECELILIKACWSATNRLRGDASKSCCLQFILSIQMRKYLVFN